MRLPNAETAIVPRRKIVDYLLSPSHRLGRHKAAFFRSFGFSSDHWWELADALRSHATANDVATAEATPFGTRFVVDGIMGTADGRSVNVRTVWFIEPGAAAPRFVTAHPLKRIAT